MGRLHIVCDQKIGNDSNPHEILYKIILLRLSETSRNLVTKGLTNPELYLIYPSWLKNFLLRLIFCIHISMYSSHQKYAFWKQSLYMHTGSNIIFFIKSDFEHNFAILLITTSMLKIQTDHRITSLLCPQNFCNKDEEKWCIEVLKIQNIFVWFFWS